MMDTVMQNGLGVTEAEWKARCDLAALYRICEDFGWTDLIDTHMSVRVPGEPNCFLINHYEEMFDEITASSLIKMDIDGKIYGKQGRFNAAGFTIHSAIHAARHDAQCVLHVHALNGIAVSAQKGGVLPISQQSIFVLSSLGYHGYEGVALRDDEKPRLVADLGPDNSFLMLRNHGLLTLGSTIADAFLNMYLFETVCTIQVRAMAGGTELISVDPRIIAGAKQQAKQVTRGIGGGALAWPGLLRKLDKADPSYRT